jgi:hypothetical protein
MSIVSRRRTARTAATAFTLAALVAAPALAGQIYSWRTEDGTTAFTDDPKAIPERYRDRVDVRESAGIDEYARYTSARGGESAYADRLSQRLDHLRALNAHFDATAPRPAAAAQPSVAINTGGLTIGVPAESSADGPVVVESVRFRHRDEQATRHNTVISQGGRVLTVIKGDPHIGPVNQAPGLSEMVGETPY